MKLFVYVQSHAESAEQVEARWGSAAEQVANTQGLYLVEQELFSEQRTLDDACRPALIEALKAASHELLPLARWEFALRLEKLDVEASVLEKGLFLRTRDGFIAGASLPSQLDQAGFSQATAEALHTLLAARSAHQAARA